MLFPCCQKHFIYKKKDNYLPKSNLNLQKYIKKKKKLKKVIPNLYNNFKRFLYIKIKNLLELI